MTLAAPARLPNLPLPVRGWPLVLLVALFLIAGSLGHDPWKNEDASHFGVVWRALAGNDWLALRFITGGDVEPPLYYWVGGALGHLLAPLFALPDAVRLASPLFGGLACGLLYLAARELYGADHAAGAPLALAGSLGFLVPSHDTQPMLATLAGFAAVYAGVALAPRRLWPAALLIGAGLAGVVLAHGVTMLPALLGGILVSLAATGERPRRAGAALLGVLAGVALAAPWLLWLHAESPAAWQAWWTSELAQFAITESSGRNALRYAELLTWFAWPALPLALWALWEGRRRLAEPALLLPLSAFLLLLANLAAAGPARFVAALALLPALALLAVPGTAALRRGAANAFDWFGRMTFTLIAGLIWLGWVAMHFGVPPKIARNFAKLAPGFEAAIDPLAVAAALVVSLLWLALISLRRAAAGTSPLRSLAHWTSGMTLIWLLTTTLWLPWIEHGKTYRSVAAAIERKVGSGCIATRGVGDAQFASLDYFLDRRLRTGRPACNWLLVQGASGEPGGDWQKVWQGARPGDKSERFGLYRRR